MKFSSNEYDNDGYDDGEFDDDGVEAGQGRGSPLFE